MATKIPAAEINLNPAFVKNLVQRQFPELAHLEIKFLGEGWDNQNYRLGEQYIVRVPRRKLGADLIENELTWLPKLKDKLPINIPAPLYIGQPQDDYPWSWSIVPWYGGQEASLQKPEASEAIRLVRFLKKLHSLPFENAPENDYRGVPLTNRFADTKERLDNLKAKTNLITDKVSDLWQQALAADFPASSHLLHGDLHPRNIIVRNKKIEAIIDWGDITSGDPATDLCCLWMLFKDKKARTEALKEYGASESLIQRAIGWAVFFGAVFLDSGLGQNQLHERIGTFILKNVDEI
jgi:aminoglycoside phosphotransferase (APT) family kinase protein